MSGDAAMAEAARSTDLYQGMVAGGAVATRAEAKVGMLGAMYGGTRGESGRMMPRLTRRYPRAIGLVEEAARAGERGEVVHTLLGRGSPAARRRVGGAAGRAWASRPTTAGRTEDRDRRRRAWGRFTRNFVVQGTGAEWALCWLADLRNRLWRLGGTGTVERAAAPGVLPARRGRRAHARAPGRRRRRGGAPGRRRGRPAALRRVPRRLPARRRRRRVLGRRGLSAAARSGDTITAGAGPAVRAWERVRIRTPGRARRTRTATRRCSRRSPCTGSSSSSPVSSKPSGPRPSIARSFTRLIPTLVFAVALAPPAAWPVSPTRCGGSRWVRPTPSGWASVPR